MGTPSGQLIRVVALLGLSGSLAQADVIYQNNFDSGIAGEAWSTQTVGSIAAPWGTFLGRFGQETATLTLGRNAGGGGDGGGGGGGGGGDGSGGATNNSGVSTLGGRRPIGNARWGGPLGLGHNGAAGARDGNGFWKTGIRPALGGGGGGDDGGDGGGGGGGGGGGTDPGVGSGEYSVFFDLYLFDTWDGYDATYGVDRFRVAINGVEAFNEVFSNFKPFENRLTGYTLAGRDAYDTRYKDVIYYGLEIRFTITEPSELLVIDFIGGTNQSIGDESWGLDNVSVVQRSGRMVPSGPTGMVLLGGLLVGGRRRR